MVTAIVNDPGAKAGQVLDWTNCSVQSRLKGSGVITRGDLLVPDTGTAPDGVKLSPTGRNAGPFFVDHSFAVCREFADFCGIGTGLDFRLTAF